jgi:hypothetical protein
MGVIDETPQDENHVGSSLPLPSPHCDPYVRAQTLRELYAASKASHILHDSNRSFSSSVTSNRSITTVPTCNTATNKIQKKYQKQRFLLFTRVLMKLLERRDPAVFYEAKAVIRDCDERKKRHESGFESMTDSVRAPLKHVVGESYWRQAHGYLKKKMNHRPPPPPPTLQSKEEEELELEPLSPTSAPPNFTPTDIACLETLCYAEETDQESAEHNTHPDYYPTTSSRSSSSRSKATLGSAAKPTSTHHNSSRASSKHRGLVDSAERKVRKERFWMLIGILMKSLEQKDRDLHLAAKAIIRDCIQRNKRHEPGYGSLTSSIRVSLKDVVGRTYWRRAESSLGHVLLVKQAAAEDDDLEMSRRLCRKRGHDHGQMEPIQILPPPPHSAATNLVSQFQPCLAFGSRGPFPFSSGGHHNTLLPFQRSRMTSRQLLPTLNVSTPSFYTNSMTPFPSTDFNTKPAWRQNMPNGLPIRQQQQQHSERASKRAKHGSG